VTGWLEQLAVVVKSHIIASMVVPRPTEKSSRSAGQIY